MLDAEDLFYCFLCNCDQLHVFKHQLTHVKCRDAVSTQLKICEGYSQM